MGTGIIKLTDPATEKEYYLKWSTVVDSPITVGMSREQMLAEDDVTEERLERADANGHSWLDDYPIMDSLMNYNRAGYDESSLTEAQILQYYCIAQGEGEEPRGKLHCYGCDDMFPMDDLDEDVQRCPACLVKETSDGD